MGDYVCSDDEAERLYNSYVSSLLVQSVIDLDYSRAQNMLQEGADVNGKVRFGYTALQWACFEECLDMATFLINNGANVDTKDNSGRTPLHWACSEKNLMVAKFLIENGSNPNARDKDGKTPLHFARYSFEHVRLLIEYGAQVDAKDYEHGKTLLHDACFLGRFAEAECLIDNGASINVNSFAETTPLHFACRKGYLAVAKLLIDNGAYINVRDNAQMTPLHFACRGGHLKVVQLLLSRGAKNLSAESSLGLTPLNLAHEKNHLEVVWLLVRRYPMSLKPCKRPLKQTKITDFYSYI